MKFEITDQAIVSRALREELLSLESGGYCSYEGWVRNRNDGKLVKKLQYTAYPELAPLIGQKVLTEAKEKFDIIAASAVHRFGLLRVGDLAVWVGVTAHHRGDTFLACRFIIDNIKYRLPIWKKEYYADGTSSWIDSNGCDCADANNLVVGPSTCSHH